MNVLELPLDIQESILASCLTTNPSISRCCKEMKQLSIPLLYYKIKLTSSLQLDKFLSVDSGSNSYCAHHTFHSLTIKVPGVPGPSYLSNESDDPERGSQGTMIKASKAISKCPSIRELSLQFYSISHSTFSTSSSFREMESRLLFEALSRLEELNHFSWFPPGKGDEEDEEERVMGISIAVVPEMISPLVNGLSKSSPNLESFEMKNVMFDEKDGGLMLFEMLTKKKKLRSCSLESVTSLNPRGVAVLALSGAEWNQELEIKIADGFLDSIWGPRLRMKDIEESMRSMLREKESEDAKEDVDRRVERAIKSVRLRELFQRTVESSFSET